MVRPAVASFVSLQQQKKLFLAELESWRPAQVAFRCAPGSWCALEVLDHVVKTERGISEYMRCSGSQRARVALSHKIRGRLLIMLMRSPSRVKVPRAASLVLPSVDSDFSALTARWQDSQDEIEAWLGNFREDPRVKGIFQHPVSGWMCVEQAIGFIAAHTRHHRYQLARIRAHSAWAQID